MSLSSELLDLVSSWYISVVDDSFRRQIGLILLARTDSSFETHPCSVSSGLTYRILWTFCPPLCSVLLVSVRLSTISDCPDNIFTDLLLDWIDCLIWLIPCSWFDLPLLYCRFSEKCDPLSCCLWMHLSLERLWVILFRLYAGVFRTLSIVHVFWYLHMVLPRLRVRRLSLTIRAPVRTVVINDFTFQSFKYFINQVSSCLHSQPPPSTTPSPPHPHQPPTHPNSPPPPPPAPPPPPPPPTHTHTHYVKWLRFFRLNMSEHPHLQSLRNSVLRNWGWDSWHCSITAISYHFLYC